MLSLSVVSRENENENLEEEKHEVSDWIASGNRDKPTTCTDSKSDEKEVSSGQGFMAEISCNEVDNRETLSPSQRVFLLEEFGRSRQSFGLFKKTWKALDPQFHKHVLE